MPLVTIQRAADDTDALPPAEYTTEPDDNSSQSEDFFTSNGTAVLQNQIGRRRSSVINEGDTIECGLKLALSLLRKEDSLKLIVNLEKVNSKIQGSRYFCVILKNGKQDQEEFIILGIDICMNTATIGLVLPICQDMSVALDGDSGFKVKNKAGEKLFKPTTVHALWSIVQLLNKACSIAHRYNYYIGGLSHTWIDYYMSKISSNRAQIAEWNRMIDANTIVNSTLAPKSAIGEYVIGTHVDEDVKNKDEIRKQLKEIMRDEDMDNVTVTFLRDKLQNAMSFNLKEYRSFIAEEILIIYGQMDSASEILPYLFLGSTYNASNLDELINNKVTHILNVTRESENFFRDRFIYKNVEVFDVDETNLINYFNDCYHFISEAKYKNSVCLVHCQRGISRSASVVIAYLMKEFNWTRDKAIEDVKSKRDCIRPNDSFMSQLKTYEGILKARRDFVCLISNISTQKNNVQFQKRNRNKILSFPNNLYKHNEEDFDLESPTNSCSISKQRQSDSQCERLASFSELTSPSSVVNNPDDVVNKGLYDNVKESSKIDFQENRLINKSDMNETELNDCFFEANALPSSFPTENISNINEDDMDMYSKGNPNEYIPDSITAIDNDLMEDFNANDESLKSRQNDFCKRSLRVKGDASWIRQPSFVVDQNIISKDDNRHSQTIDGINNDEEPHMCLRKCDSPELDPETIFTMTNMEIDKQSLRPVKELLTKYSNI